jgi:hypothetical protein
VYTVPKLDKLWSRKMENAGGPITVLCNATTVYVGTYGSWTRCTAAHHYTSSTSATSLATMRFASHSTRCLYIGTNGYGGLYDATTLEQKYLVSLRYNVTDVVSVGNSAFFASRGQVFQMDSGGNVTASNDLDGFGNNNVNLTLLSSDMLIASPDGYLVRLLMLEKLLSERRFVSLSGSFGMSRFGV